MKHFFLALCLSCSSAPLVSPGASLSPVPASVPSSAPSSAPTSPSCILPASETDLQQLRGWGSLAIGMSTTEAAEALKKANIEFKVEVTHGYFSPPPGQPVSHSTNESWRFSCQGWAGTAEIDPTLTKINSISIESPLFGNEEGAKKLFDAYTKNFGAPQSEENYSSPAVTRIDHCWQNTQLKFCVLLIQSVQAEKQVWQFMQQYSSI
jgi:hypothetical protein